MELTPKVKLGMLGIGVVFIIGGWISLFLSLKGNKKAPLETNIQGTQQGLINEGISGGTSEISNNGNTNEASLPTKESKPQFPLDRSRNERESDSVTILIPPHFPNYQRIQISNLIKERNGISLIIKQYPNEKQYETAVQYYISNPEKIDMIMLPSNRIESFEGRGVKYRLPIDLISFTHPSFESWMSEQPFTYFPYALDPFVIFTKKDIFDDEITLQDIFLFQSENQTTTEKLPIPYGIEREEIALLQTKKLLLPSLTYLMKYFVSEALDSGRTDWLLLLINNNQRSSQLFNEFKNSLSKFPQCIASSQICLVLNNKSTVGFDFLSSILYWTNNNNTSENENTLDENSLDQDSLDEKASQNLKNERLIKENLEIYALPRESNTTYPLRGWGIVVSEQSPNQETTRQRINAYLEGFVRGDISYPAHLLSASINTIQWQIVQEDLLRLQSILQTDSIITGTIQNDDSILYSESFKDLLQGKITNKVFLQRNK